MAEPGIYLRDLPALGLPTADSRIAGVRTNVGTFTVADLAQVVGDMLAATPDVEGVPGAVGDGVADDTAALQAAINAVQALAVNGRPGGELKLGGKSYRHTGLTISRPIIIDGGGALLQHLPGASGPELTIALAHEGYNYYTDGHPPPAVYVRHVSFRGDAAAAQDGLVLANASTNPIYSSVFFEECEWLFSGRDSLSANTWSGYAGFDRCRWRRGGRDQINIQASPDFRFIGCDLATAERYSVNVLNTSEIRFVGTYIYASNGDGVLLTESGVSFHGCSIDRHKKVGLIYANTNHRGVSAIDCNFSLNSQLTPDAYSDVLVKAGTNGKLAITQGIFSNPTGASANYNIEFEGGAGVAVVVEPNWQNRATSYDASITNTPAKLLQVGTISSGHVIDGSTTIRTGTQFRGVFLRAADDVQIASIAGTDSSNKGGVLRLFNPDASLGLKLSAQFSGDTSQLLLPAGSTFSLPPYTFATLPAAATVSGCTVRVTDRSQRPATSDGTNWRFADGSIAS